MKRSYRRKYPGIVRHTEKTFKGKARNDPLSGSGSHDYTKKKKFQKGLKRTNAVPVIRKAAGSVKASINMFFPM